MRVGRTGGLAPQDVGIELPGGIKIKSDGWDVLLVIALVALVLNFLVAALQPWGLWAAIALVILWIVLSLARPKKE